MNIEAVKERGTAGDIIFTFNNNNILSKLIWKLSTYGIKITRKEKKVSHVGIYLHDGIMVEMHFGGLRIINIEAYNKKKYDIYWARPLKTLDNFGLYRYIYGRVGMTKYSYSQIFVIAIKKLLWLDKVKDVDRDGMECIEFLVNAFHEVGIDICPGKRAWEATPFDLYHSKEIGFMQL